MEQEPRILVSLHKYFPKNFFQRCTTVACHMVEVEMEEPSKGKAISTEEEKTITPKECLPTHFSIEGALWLPKKMRRALAAVLASPDDHEVQESRDKADTQRHKDNVKLLKTNAVFPLTQLGNAKVARLPQGFIKALPKRVEPSFFQPRGPKKVLIQTPTNSCRRLGTTSLPLRILERRFQTPSTIKNVTSPRLKRSWRSRVMDLTTIRLDLASHQMHPWRFQAKRKMLALNTPAWALNKIKRSLNPPLECQSSIGWIVQGPKFWHLIALVVKTEPLSSRGLTRQHPKALILKGCRNLINEATRLALLLDGQLWKDLKTTRSLQERGWQRQRNKSSTG